MGSFCSAYMLYYMGGSFTSAVFQTALMGKAVLGGMNVAIAYGFALILAALLLALVYMALCRGAVSGDSTRAGQGGAQ